MARREQVFGRREFRDPVTRARVTRITPEGHHCLRNYFYQKSFTSNGSHLILGADIAGSMDFWVLELATGRARALTWGQDESIQGAYLSPDDRWLYFTRQGRQHLRVELATGREEVVYEVPAGWIGYGTWNPNSDGTRTAALLMKTEDRVTDGPGGWERFAAQYAARPLQQLIEIDLTTGTSHLVWEERRYLGHPMYRPHHKGQMGFCHEGPHDLVDSRIWFIDSDGTRLRPGKQHAPGEAVMHEFWVPDGSRLHYVSYVRGESTRSIWSVDPDTLVNRRWMSMPPCAHLMSNAAGDLLVGDGAGQLGDVADTSGFEHPNDPLLYLFDLTTLTSRPLCGHFSSWKIYRGNTQASHPHPSFTPDGTQVLFASDFEGHLALYLVDVP